MDNHMLDLSHAQEILTVSQLNRDIKLLLENNYSLIWIEGELSGFKAHTSGHWYFTLKDANAQVRCAMFRGQNARLNLNPKDGMHVMMKARVSLYEARGDYQLYVEHMEDIGVGKLQKQFEELKKKLMAAGLFDAVHKKSLPAFPKQIGIITSPTGAAIKDILSVLKRRLPSIPIIIYPTLVQGELAAAQIAAAIATANRRQECDVLMLTRGGGSLEDLWPFNEEIVAHAIFQSSIPIISGVGHEIDFTIADFVADVRAPTPSAAAELIVPDRKELLQTLQKEQQLLSRHMLHQLQQRQQQLQWMRKHLQQQHPKRRLQTQQQTLDQLEIQLVRLQKQILTTHQTQLKNYYMQLLALNPAHLIRTLQQECVLHFQKMKTMVLNSIQLQQQKLSSVAGKLDGLSPLATLQRGYAIATNDEGVVLRDAAQTTLDDSIHVQLMRGRLICKLIDKKS